MERTFWQKQTREPLFPDILWSRPVRKSAAGTLLIIGGHSGALSRISEMYVYAIDAGAGEVKIVLPETLRAKMPTSHFDIVYAPTTTTGSLGLEAYSDIAKYMKDANGTLLAGSFGSNSETVQLLGRTLKDSSETTILAGDALDTVASEAANIFNLPVTIISELSQIQQFFKRAQVEHAVRVDDGILNLVDTFHAITEQSAVKLVTFAQNQLIVANGGQVSTTPCKQSDWLAKTTAVCSVLLMQRLGSPFEVLTAAAFDIDSIISD